MTKPRYKLYNCDCIEGMGKLPAGRIQTCVYSPPYFNQRDYGVDGQLGLEAVHDCLGWATGSPCGDCYVCHQVSVARAVWRVLRDDGTLWVNIGEKYVDRQLLGSCWRLALALQSDGWFLRQDIIWSKPNPMPSPSYSKCVPAHEYFFLLSKSEKYFFDYVSIMEKGKGSPNRGTFRGGGSYTSGRSFNNSGDNGPISTDTQTEKTISEKIIKRSVWEVPIAGEKETHFAAYPSRLILPCILAGTSAKGRCPDCYAPYKRITERQRIATRPGTDTKVTGNSAVDGNRDPERHVTSVKTIGWEPTCDCDAGNPLPCIVLDPFCGTGTTIATAIRKNRWGIGFELNPKYIEMCHKKIKKAIATKGFGF